VCAGVVEGVFEKERLDIRCDAVCCSVLQRVVVCCSVSHTHMSTSIQIVESLSGKAHLDKCVAML